jgi:SAM-dependent methyltransferase
LDQSDNIEKYSIKDVPMNAKLYSIRRHPSIIVEFVKAHKWKEIEDKCARLDEKESLEFISYLKKTSAYLGIQNGESKLNRLCDVEDWQKREIRDTLSELQKLSSDGFIHRKDWEWALGIVAMSRFGKLNDKSTAIGIGSGTEPVPFYLANKINHVYATDIYRGHDGWKRAAPSEFPENPKKYAPFPYREDSLTVLRMDGTKLEFPSESFDIAFSFSSIEHFGGKNHSGSLRALQEIERVLKPGGLAVITTEYIINDKEHPEFFNRRTIYSDLIDKLEKLQLVEPLDLRITTKTLDTMLDFFSIDANWDNLDYEFKKTHPLILVRVRNVLFTSLMLVFQRVSIA